jgi:hypothetical protein
MIFRLRDLEDKAKIRPHGYKDEVLAVAKKIGDELYEISESDFEKLSDKYRLPSRLQMFRNVLEAAKLVIKDGPTRRSHEEVESIMPICAKCPMLIDDEFRCGVCGCFLGGIKNGKFKFGKMYLANWHCPKDKW